MLYVFFSAPFVSDAVAILVYISTNVPVQVDLSALWLDDETQMDVVRCHDEHTKYRIKTNSVTFIR